MITQKRVWNHQKSMAHRILGVMLAIVIFIGSSIYAFAEANPSREVVRVGFFAFDGYHMVDENGNRSGYGYDFLRLAARYMDVDFEYVGYDKSWDDMLEMLKNGEIDLLTSIQKTPEREAVFNFSKAIGTSSALLTVKGDNFSIIEQDYKTYQDMRVGMLRENSRNDDFAKLAAENGFSYQIVYYDMEDDIEKALQAGEIDTALTSSLRSIHDERVLERFATSDFYVAVQKGNTELLGKIDAAIDQMNIAEGDWKDELNYEYYGRTEARPFMFSDHEKEIIRQYAEGEKTLTVTCNIDSDPYSYVENGKLKGIIPDLFAELMGMAGIPYQIVVPKDRQEYEQWKKDASIDIFMDARITSENEVEEKGAAITVPYLNMGIAMVTRRDFDGTIKKLAIADYQGAAGIEENLALDAERVVYDSRKDAIKAVQDGKVDATFVYLYTAQKYVNQDDFGKLTYTALEEPVYPHRICIMPSAPHELSGILTKCIYAFPQNKLESLIAEYTSYKATNVSLFTLIRIYPVKSALVLLCVILLLMYLVGMVVTLRDKQKLLVTEQKRTEEKEILAKIAQTANESKSRFLFNMSHDIRTPLNAVLGFTNLAKDSIGDRDKERDYLDKIQISGEHLLEIVNDVLEMSRVEMGNIKLEEKPCCLTDIIKDAVIMTEESSKKKKQNFTVDMPELKYPYVSCDSLRVKEILVNLLENAVKFTPEKGSISLSVRQDLNTDPEYVNLHVCVKDTGCGMSKAFLEKLFQPFEREKTATLSGHSGTGLGLTVTKRYIDAMGGIIQVSSEVGKGTEMIVSLQQKRSEKPKKDTETVSMEEAKKTFYGKRLLVVEDNDLNREIEAAILEDAGFLVEEAGNGQEAVEKIKDSQEGYYAGILMDIQMPVMDGYEATREIRKLQNAQLAKTPIIAVSANAFDEDKEASAKAGMNAHIEKPIQLDYLFRTLESLLR